MIKPGKTKRERELLQALFKIACMGKGLKEEMRDWSAIGRNAVFEAREALAGKCKTCKRRLEFK